MVIRRFRESDAVQLARLHRSTIRAVNKKDYPAKQIKAWSGRVSARRHRKYSRQRVKFVAIENGRLVGFAEYKDDEIMGLYVHKDYMKRGIGKRLLVRVERHAYSKGIRVLKCTSTVTARLFYERNGYRTIRKTKHAIGRYKLSVYRMRKRLRRYNEGHK